MAYTKQSTVQTTMWTTTIDDTGTTGSNTYRIVSSKGAHGISSITISKTSGANDSVNPDNSTMESLHNSIATTIFNNVKGSSPAM